jgi:CubicO group peptidase (beta-lactamase class C family)
MKLLLLLITLTIVPAAGQKSENQAIHDLLVETISVNKIPGMIAAVGDSNGIRSIACAGIRKTGAPETIHTDDHFHLGSCTKAMTAALLATLVARGEIKWETTIIDGFPELKEVIHADYHSVTLHQLLTHRSGVPANAANWWAFADQEIMERRVTILKENLKKPSQNKAGNFNYSNLGYMIAGSMAERITGKSWEDLIKERLFEPLGMSSAGFGPPGTRNQVDQPWGHGKSIGKWHATQIDNAEALGPAGRVHCTLEDWMKFISLFLKQGDNPILERNQLDKLIDPVGEYACGWGVTQRDWAKGFALTHNGSNNSWLVTIWVAPEINRAYIVGTNSFDENTAGVCDKVIGKLIGM